MRESPKGTKADLRDLACKLAGIERDPADEGKALNKPELVKLTSYLRLVADQLSGRKRGVQEGEDA